MGKTEIELFQPLASQELVIFVGLPGSGKSTLYRRLFAATHAHISLDVLRKRSRERRALEEHLAAGRSVVVDNTNVLRAERAVYLEIAQRYHVPARCIFFATSLKDALRRNAARQGRARIPDVAVIAKYKALEPPALEEGFTRIQVVRLQDNGTIVLERDTISR
ncbi:MAG: hypothetical protein KatS3mg057_1998 [Herpetosiphonaceae bacterium]|nr:MAG: hypothetical protein KatS3mg057_1998 [Herpetosiphonaceae bacterium]